MSSHAAHRAQGPGRPISYDRDAVLAAVVDVFWRDGYEAASTEALTAATGLSRSSFYSCFGSKKGALAAAFAAYADRGLAAMRAVAEAAGGGVAGARAVMAHMADPHGDPRGCFLVNAVAELAAADADFAAAGRAATARIEALLTELLAPTHADRAAATARAAMALGLGGAVLRKGGARPEALAAMLEAAEPLLRPPG
ncbi:MAG: TetR/AcrR family transcriptional regulator [Rubrimonas sp.]